MDFPWAEKKQELVHYPTRAGSKRTFRKNVRDFFGKPIIAYSIEKALKSRLFEEVMVSTDDVEIKRIAEEYGASVPFLRSRENSGDFSSTEKVLVEVLEQYRKNSRELDFCCCLYATAPLLTVEVLQEAGFRLIDGNWDLVIPIQKANFPLEQALRIRGNGLKWFFPSGQN